MNKIPPQHWKISPQHIENTSSPFENTTSTSENTSLTLENTSSTFENTSTSSTFKNTSSTLENSFLATENTSSLFENTSSTIENSSSTIGMQSAYAYDWILPPLRMKVPPLRLLNSEYSCLGIYSYIWKYLTFLQCGLIGHIIYNWSWLVPTASLCNICAPENTSAIIVVRYA